MQSCLGFHHRIFHDSQKILMYKPCTDKKHLFFIIVYNAKYCIDFDAAKRRVSSKPSRNPDQIYLHKHFDHFDGRLQKIVVYVATVDQTVSINTFDSIIRISM